MVNRGDFLLQIDPEQYEAAVQRAEAGLSSAKAQAAQARANFLQAKRGYDRNIEMRKTNAHARFRRRDRADEDPDGSERGAARGVDT